MHLYPHQKNLFWFPCNVTIPDHVVGMAKEMWQNSKKKLAVALDTLPEWEPFTDALRDMGLTDDQFSGHGSCDRECGFLDDIINLHRRQTTGK